MNLLLQHFHPESQNLDCEEFCEEKLSSDFSAVIYYVVSSFIHLSSILFNSCKITQASFPRPFLRLIKLYKKNFLLYILTHLMGDVFLTL